ncbi:hypothetical protein F5Y14DRAFT_461606 [Nemania sp. NC0429]|nr:hypothetical protein F5Y14DRAFT_461606 [Nemania sp. NC0429]
MVGFVERFRKPKSPIALGSPQNDGVIPPQVSHVPRNTTPLVPRNFSYPTNLTIGSGPPPSTSPPPSTWDLLGQICNFSPDVASEARRDRTAGLEDPFFYTTDRAPYKQLVDLEEEIITNPVVRSSAGSVTLFIEPAKSAERCEPKNKSTKTYEAHSAADRIFPQKSNITTRLRRSSLGHHKTYSSFDASRLLVRRSGSFERPMSSSGVPLIDTKFTQSKSTAAKINVPPLSFAKDNIDYLLADLGKATFISYGLADAHAVEMGLFNLRDSPQGLPRSQSQSGVQQQNYRVPESDRHKGKEGKPKWYTQLKDWVSLSEPSTQALRNYKKDTFDKAGIALDDPLANVKLHLPVASLPPDAVKPGGRGPDPEDIALKRAIQRKGMRDLMSVAGPSQGSQSSVSHYSTSSSVTVRAIKESK